jgi:hypothetical protein
MRPVLIPFKSTASDRVTPISYADPGRMFVKSFIPFRVPRFFPLKTIIENGKRETGNEKVTNSIDATFYGEPNFVGLSQNHVF